MVPHGSPQARCSWWLLPLVLVLGCQPPTEITLEISTDIACGELRGTAITVGGAGEIEGKDATTVTSTCSSDGRIGSLVVVPSGASNEHVALKIVAGRNYPVDDCRPSADPAHNYGPHDSPSTGCVVARRELSFIRHTPLKLDIDLRSSCVGEPCRPDQTCVGGSCVSSTIPDESVCSTEQGCAESVLGTTAPPLDITAIWGRGNAICATHESGPIVCWGWALNGQLGNGATSPASPVVPAMLGTQDAPQVETGDTHSCVVQQTGAVQCTGSNDRGQLGDGTTSSTTNLVDVSLDQAIQVALGKHDSSSHTCAIADADQNVYCWGDAGVDSGAGKLGNDVPAGFQPTPLPVSGLSHATDLSAGMDTTCAVIPPGSVKCWGANDYGQLGAQGTGEPSTLPLEVALPAAADAVSVSTYHACARLAGEIWCWGEGYPGDGTQGLIPQPTRANDIDDAVQVGTGVELTCVRRATGEVWCWGKNDAGQLGLGGPSAPVAEPSAVPGIDDAVDLMVGPAYACALRSQGRVWCWGANGEGQISGDGTTTPNMFPSPHEVAGL